MSPTSQSSALTPTPTPTATATAAATSTASPSAQAAPEACGDTTGPVPAVPSSASAGEVPLPTTSPAAQPPARKPLRVPKGQQPSPLAGRLPSVSGSTLTMPIEESAAQGDESRRHLHEEKTSRPKPSSRTVSLATQRFKRLAGADARHQVQQRVEHQVDAEINRWNADFVNVRWVYLVIGQSLPAAALLQNLYKHALEAQDTGCSPWVYRTPVRWFLTTGLREESFLLAREELRKLGLIMERRRFDHDRQEIVVEMCVDRDIFDAMYDGAIEAVRRRYREDLSDTLPDHRDA